MTSTLTITRRDERGEDRDFLVDVSRDRDGDIWSTCAEDVPELRTTNRYGSIETYPTGHLLFKKGEPIELEDDELTEAEAALTQLESLWNAERTRLREIFRPAERPPSDPPAEWTSCSHGALSPSAPAGRLPDVLPEMTDSATAKCAASALLPPHDLLNSLGAGITLPPGLHPLPSTPNPIPNPEESTHGRRC